MLQSFIIFAFLISYAPFIVNGSAIWIFWDKGLENALEDPFKRACYDSIVRAAQVAGLPVIVGDANFDTWLVDKEDIDFKVFRDLQAAQKYQKQQQNPEANRNFAVLADAWRLSIIYKYGGIYLDFSTYIADPYYFKRVWEEKVKAKSDSPNQFYGYKSYRKAVGAHGDEPYEYQVWLLAAPRLSNFVGLWKNLVIGKLMSPNLDLPAQRVCTARSHNGSMIICMPLVYVNRRG